MTGPIDSAIAGGVAYIERVQRLSGELPVEMWSEAAGEADAQPDSAVFPTAVAALALHDCPPARAFCDRARAFLLDEMLPRGLWRHWTRAHVTHLRLPADLDDTSCASAFLAAVRARFPDNRALLLANRDDDGRFRTWIVPRWPPVGSVHFVATLRQLLHLPSMFLFFRQTAAAPADVDPVVNANVLFYLGDFAGGDAIADWLAGIVERDEEAASDKWYDSPLVVLYFLGRALAPRRPSLAGLFCQRLMSLVPQNALDRALAMLVALAFGVAPREEDVLALLAAQRPDGAWPRASFYTGGRERLASGHCAPVAAGEARWGSEALTTAFVVQALWGHQRATGGEGAA